MLGYLTGRRHEKALHGMRDPRLDKVEQTTPKLRAAPLIEQGRSIFGGVVSAAVIDKSGPTSRENKAITVMKEDVTHEWLATMCGKF